MPSAFLHCPIRGQLNVPERAADGLTFTEEKRRIDCIQFLLAKGYPPTHFKIETALLRFGNKGRNSFRTDLAILDIPLSTLANDIEVVKPHIKLIAEIKRDHDDAKAAKQTQIFPALDFLQDIAAFGIYWDDVEQRLFYRTIEGTKTKTHETTLAVLPQYGQSFTSRRLRFSDLQNTNLQQLFQKIEDKLHTQIVDQSRRFEVMLQLMLIKLYDEYAHGAASDEMSVQDFSEAPIGDREIVKLLEGVLGKSVKYYGKYLPKPVSSTLGISGAMLRGISSLLAPSRILGSRRDVIQGFYMYFAKGVYKWDLAQYFTPSEVVDFIVAVVNPQAGEQVKDPACGSGDFLISSFHHAMRIGADLREAIWGADNSENAVQVCILNMVLNGDGKGNIKQEDSLASVNEELDTFNVMLCNPPFGVRIQEQRFEVLSNFDLGHEWKESPEGAELSQKVLKSQEVGLLFAELCVKQTQAGGRIGIILPNGYLGNRSLRYVAFREWLLRQTRLVAVVAFPRFTFKKSGADVSASAVIVEKRETPLVRATDSQRYPFYVGIMESVGWSVSDKKAERIFRRDLETGAYITNERNEPVPDADFDRVLYDLWGSQTVKAFPWLMSNVTVDRPLPTGWSVDIHSVISRPDLSIDPKRWCEKVAAARRRIMRIPHFTLREVADIIMETGVPKNERAVYQYVEIQDTSDGIVTPTPLRGWQLPDRAKHTAQTGDIFVGGIWGSVGKWFVAGGDCTALVVSNGFRRLRLKPGKQAFLVDILAGLNTEAYRIQARAFATGSDGLAELSEGDLLEIILPQILDEDARLMLWQLAEALLTGRATVASVVEGLRQQQQIPTVKVQSRSTHWVQV